jgi:hypothetical protein
MTLSVWEQLLWLWQAVVAVVRFFWGLLTWLAR